MRWRPVSIKQAILSGELTGWYLNFRWRVSTSNNLELCQDAKTYSEKYYVCQGFWAQLSYLLRLKTTVKTKARYNKV
ncbi:glycosyltransferase [Salmonella enterica subsp. houtenae]|nr:glycosyltransferase [Salmonella enterica subsp. houtenae]